MRTLVLMLAFTAVLDIAGASAQAVAVEQGGLMLSGAVSFTTSGGDLYESDGDRFTQVTLAPGIGYFVANGLSIGGVMGYTYFSQGDDSSHALAIGPRLVYFFDSGTNALPFVGGAIQLLNVGNEDDSETGFGFSLGGGVTLLTSEHLGIAFEVTYQYERYSPEGFDDSITGNTIALGASLLGFIH